MRIFVVFFFLPLFVSVFLIYFHVEIEFTERTSLFYSFMSFHRAFSSLLYLPHIPYYPSNCLVTCQSSWQKQTCSRSSMLCFCHFWRSVWLGFTLKVDKNAHIRSFLGHELSPYLNEIIVTFVEAFKRYQVRTYHRNM